MKKKYAGRIFFRAGVLLSMAWIFSACASSASSASSAGSVSGASSAGSVGGTNGASREDPVTGRQKQKPPPLPLVVSLYQEAVYNGKPQPLSYTYAGEDEPEIIYYPSPKARDEERGGSYSAPIRTGAYYALIRSFYEEVFVEYRILKCPVRIEAAEIQAAFYDGNPKRVLVNTEPQVPLSYSYYPNPELRDAAVKAAMEAALIGDTGQSIAEIFKGYKRVDRAPVEQGTYYVWVYFPGDENHEAAQAYVEFTILPPRLK